MFAGLIPMDVSQVLTRFQRVLIYEQINTHLRRALNDGAAVEEDRAVREVVIQTCEAAGMQIVGVEVPAGWGQREKVASI